MSDKEQFREVVWQIVEKYYNVSRQDPHLLTSKKLQANGINNIADDLYVFMEQMLTAFISPPPEEDKNLEDEDR